MNFINAICYIAIVCGVSVTCSDPELENEELRAHAFLMHLNTLQLQNNHKAVMASWNYVTNLTDANKLTMISVNTRVATEMRKQWEEVKKFNYQLFKNNDIKRRFKLLSDLGEAALPEDKYKKIVKIISDMEEIYSTAKVCDFKDEKKCNLFLNPDLEHVLSTSDNTSELEHVWVEWRNAIGPKVKHMFKEYVELKNEAARLNNFTDAAAHWLDGYETPDMKKQIEIIWMQLKPLYLQIHAYVRHQLRKKYGDLVTEKGPIPAHLLGNMWAQSWDYIYESSKPYPLKNATSVTEEMIKQGYDHIKIFKTAEDFFVSLNLSAMPESFWKHSMLQKPTDRDVICHAAAYDFYDSENFRIKQCTLVNEEDLIIAHHEMGHIQYYLQYKNLPNVYRSGANDGFHEAIGDVIALSVETQKHLRKLGLSSAEDDDETELNNLYKIGLKKIAFLPFGYIMDLWRWDVFTGNTTSHEYNCKWWKYVEEYQGIEPPVDRTEKDFDPASKYHIVANVPYLRYFIAFILQFQFQRSLCLKAGEYEPHNAQKPLHKCDIYQSTEAGNVFGKMLQMGASHPWQDAMEVVTGQRNMDASGVLEYFKPLQVWLEAENKKNGAVIGWEPSKKLCVRSRKDLRDRRRSQNE